MQVQRGKLVKQADGSLQYVTWYEDNGPGRARVLGSKRAGGSAKFARRSHAPLSGASVTLGVTEPEPGASELQAAIDNLNIDSHGTTKRLPKRRTKQEA